MRDLSHVKKVEEMINEIKTMRLTLAEKMYYVYTLFLGDLTEEMKESLRTDIHLHEELKNLAGKKDKKTKEKYAVTEKKIQERDKEISKKLPELVKRIKMEVDEYASVYETEKWQKKEEEKRIKEAKKIEAIKNKISKKQK